MSSHSPNSNSSHGDSHSLQNVPAPLPPTHSPPLTPKSSKAKSPKLSSSAFSGSAAMLPPSNTISKLKSPKPSPLLLPKTAPRAPGGSPKLPAASPRKKNFSPLRPLPANHPISGFQPPPSSSTFLQSNTGIEMGFSQHWLPGAQVCGEGAEGYAGGAVEDSWAAFMEPGSSSPHTRHFNDDAYTRLLLVQQRAQQLGDTLPHFPPPPASSAEQFLRPHSPPLHLLHDQLLQDTDPRAQVWDHTSAAERYAESFGFERVDGRPEIWRRGDTQSSREDFFFNDGPSDFMLALDAEVFIDSNDDDSSRSTTRPTDPTSNPVNHLPQASEPATHNAPYCHQPDKIHRSQPTKQPANSLPAALHLEANGVDGNCVASDFAALFFGESGGAKASTECTGHEAMYFMKMNAEMQARAWKGGSLPQNLRKRCKGCTRITARCCSCDITIGVCHMCWPVHAQQHGIYVPPGEDTEGEDSS